jgi:hypothetical protein
MPMLNSMHYTQKLQMHLNFKERKKTLLSETKTNQLTFVKEITGIFVE